MRLRGTATSVSGRRAAGVDLLDVIVGEGQDAVVIIDPVNLADAALSTEIVGLFADAEIPGDTFRGVDVMCVSIAYSDRPAERAARVLNFGGCNSCLPSPKWCMRIQPTGNRCRPVIEMMRRRLGCGGSKPQGSASAHGTLRRCRAGAGVAAGTPWLRISVC
ncbi:hypothetical protein MesoLj131a_57810 [Mesorhizobium sp. 131-2-1]|nr:hypothetical protein MesoLj131a_57810 [Mesorhizobium sp. 131-2-1]